MVAPAVALLQKEIAFALEKIAYYTAMADSGHKAQELAYWTKKLNDARAALNLLGAGTGAGAGAGAAGGAGGGGAGGQAARHVIPRVLSGVGRVATFGAAKGTAAVAVGVGTIVAAGVLIWVAAGVVGGMMGDKPIAAVKREPQGQPPGALQGPVSGDALPTSSGSGGGLGGNLGPIPETVDRTSFTGVWVKGSGTTAVSRAVLVQTGSDVKGRVEVPEGIYGENSKILIARGTYDLTGTIADGTLKFTMDKFTGELSLNPTGNRGMFLSGFMNAPGGRYLGTPVDLRREVLPPK